MSEIGKRDYKNGKIYVIRNSTDEDIYIGSSCQPLCKRFQKHKDNMKGYKKDRKLYSKMNKLGKEQFYIELYEEYPCDNVEQLRRREGEIIRELKPILNKQVAGRTEKEWREDNKDYVKEERQKYYEENKDKLSQYHKEWYEENKEEQRQKHKEYRAMNRDKILEQKREYHHRHKDRLSEEKKQYYQDNKEYFQEKARQHREENKEKCNEKSRRYYERNKEKVNAKKKQYREEHKEELKEKRNMKCQCECGKIFTHNNKSRHLKSQYHQNFILNNNIDNVSQKET